MDKELIFLTIAVFACFLTASVLLYPLRRVVSLIRWGIITTIPVFVVFFLWQHDFFSHIPQATLKTAALDFEKLHENFKKDPNNLTYLTALNDYYLEKNEFSKSLKLLENSIQKAPKNSLLKVKLAEALILSDGGEIKEDTRALFIPFQKDSDDEARALAKFYIGLYHAQQGDFYDALYLWKEIVRESHMDDPWLALVVPAIKKISGDLNLPIREQIPKPKPLRGSYPS